MRMRMAITSTHNFIRLLCGDNCERDIIFFFVFASWRKIYSRSERIIPVKPASFVQPTSPTSLCNTQRGIRNYARCAPYRAHRFSAFLLNPKNKETQATKFESDMSSRVRHVQWAVGSWTFSQSWRFNQIPKRRRCLIHCRFNCLRAPFIWPFQRHQTWHSRAWKYESYETGRWKNERWRPQSTWQKICDM